MPLYEYDCVECGRRFEELVFGRRTPKCPSCGAARPRKLTSAFAVGAGGGARAQAQAPAGSCGSCGDPGGPGSCSR